MSLSAIRKRIREDYNGIQLLESLPSHHSLQWIPWTPQPGKAPTDLPEALILGTLAGRDIVAYVTQKGDKPHEVRYCSKPKCILSGYSIKSLTQDGVVTMSLNAPFKYNADLAKGNKRKFSVIIKWYFMVRGLLENAVSGDMADWCKILYSALNKIESGRDADKGKSIKGREDKRESQEMPLVIQNSPEAAERSNVYALRSARRGEDGNAKEEAVSPLRPRIDRCQTRDTGEPSDYEALCDYLEQRELSYLLKNIHEVDELQFFDGKLSPYSLPKKLFLGRNQNNDNIYAHMQMSQGKHSVRYWSRDSASGSAGFTLLHQDIGKQTIIHPFNKTYTKDRRSLTTADQERLDILVKWYFIAGGIASMIVLHENPTYPERLVSTLSYIADRMGPAAAPPPTSLGPSNSIPHVSSHPRPVDESHIQSSLANIIPLSPTTFKPSPRGTKRTAEDAAFEDLHRNVEQDMALTAEMNGIDAELELLEMKKQNLLHQWKIEQDCVLEKRERVTVKREEVRRNFRRLTQNVHGSGGK
jgi:hypothetical protein